MAGAWSDPAVAWNDTDVTWAGDTSEIPEPPAAGTCEECWAQVLVEHAAEHADWHRAPRTVTVLP